MLDTSFWSMACHLNLDPFLWEFYERPILAPQAVVDEVVDVGRRGPWFYSDQLRMPVALEDGRLSIPVVAYSPYHSFGYGERHAIGLARSLGSNLLINDCRPYVGAKQIGIAAVPVTQFVVLIWVAGMMNEKQTLTLLDHIDGAGKVNDILVTQARAFVNRSKREGR